MRWCIGDGIVFLSSLEELEEPEISRLYLAYGTASKLETVALKATIVLYRRLKSTFNALRDDSRAGHVAI